MKIRACANGWATVGPMPRAQRPSLTAVKVARVLVHLGHRRAYAPLLPAGAAERTQQLLLQAGLLKPWMVRWMQRPAYNRALEQIGDWFSPGQAVRIGLRKRLIDDEVRDALNRGATQVLVVGAGFDTLCSRLAGEYPACRFVEIDHPATHGVKRNAMQALGWVRPNLELLGVDLSQVALSEALLRHIPAWDRSRQTVVVAEGLLMYLHRHHVARFFGEVHTLTRAGSLVVFSYLKSDAKGRPYTGRVGWLTRASLALMGEGLHWSVASIEALATFVETSGFALESEPARFDLGVRYLVPAGIEQAGAAPFEFLAVARHRAE